MNELDSVKNELDSVKRELKRVYGDNRFYTLIINKMQGTTVFDNAVYETHKHFHLSNECLDVCLVCMELIE
tara:strand:- start:203 stop:415 length:213 start_codon:yes stop_codon:yes gene_type:complete